MQRHDAYENPPIDPLDDGCGFSARSMDPGGDPAVVAGVIAVLLGIAAILRSDMAYALSAIPSGLAFLGVAVWARRSAPARVAANRNGARP